MRGERHAESFGILLPLKMSEREMAVGQNEKRSALQIDSQRLRLRIALPSHEARIIGTRRVSIRIGLI